MKPKNVEQRILNALRDVLIGVPFLNITPSLVACEAGSAMSPDAVIDVGMAKGGRKMLVMEIRNIGQPRQIREATNQLLRFTSGRQNAYGIVGAPYISPAAAKICEEEGIGYVDLAGNCRLVFDTVYIVREGAKNPFAQKRDLRSLYSPRATRVLRVLLNNLKVDWKTLALADAAEVSVGQVANVKKLLKDREWTTESKNGFRLRQPADLLEEWSDNYALRKNNARDFYSMSSMATIEDDLAEACSRRNIKFALTGLSGAARVYPGIRYPRAWCFVSEVSDDLIADVGLKPVSSGANVTLLVPFDEGVFNGTTTYEGISVVSPVQLYIDLKNYKGRGEEAARIIYEKVLLESW